MGIGVGCMTGSLAADMTPAQELPSRGTNRTLMMVYAATAANLMGGQVFTLLLFGLLLPAQVGLINWATAAGGISFYIADLGMETSLVVAAKNHRIALSTMTLIVGSLRLATAALVALVLAILWSARLVASPETSALALIGLGLFARSLQTPFSAHLQVRNKQAVVAVVQLVPIVGRLGGVAVLWLSGHIGVVPVLLVMLAGDIAGLLLMVAAARTYPDGRLTGELRLFIGDLARSAPLVTLSQVLLVGQNRLDWLLVAAFASYGALANYSLANKALEILILGGSVFGRTALPWLVEGWEAHNLGRMVRWLAVVLVVAGLVLALAGLPALQILFGHKYDGAGPVIPILAALAPALGIYQVTQFAAFARGRARDGVISGAVGLAAQIAIDLIAIPRLGIVGAALGMCAFAVAALPIQLSLGRRGTIIPARMSLELLAGAAVLPAILLVVVALRKL
jgi:O-antigen/teichoic acid export membrane protein